MKTEARQLQEVTLSQLGQIDNGKVGTAFARHLRNAIADCVDRPGDPTKRQVVVTLNITPVDEEGVCSRVHTEIELKDKVPPRRTRPYAMAVKASGKAYIGGDLDDVDQLTIDQA